jgi:drug/metabolite transporter (DMT)-like permease
MKNLIYFSPVQIFNRRSQNLLLVKYANSITIIGMFTTEELIIICSEIALSLHPILLKTVDVPLLTQLIIRLGSFSILGGALSNSSNFVDAWGSLNDIKASILIGILNLIHIGCSYTSYLNLSAGSSIAIFYIYPFLNILAGVLFLNEKMNWYILPLLFIAFIGVLCIGYDEKYNIKENFTQNKNVSFGILMALLAALTESIIYIFIKSTNSKSPFTNILQLYPVGFILLFLYSIFDKFKNIKGSLTQILQIIAFNCCIGFVGYVLRFYSIPRTSTIIFSLLAFVGVLSGYIWGILFAKERLSWLSILGSILITFSVGIKNYIRPI